MWGLGHTKRGHDIYANFIFCVGNRTTNNEVRWTSKFGAKKSPLFYNCILIT